jgi:hypothetical protein
MYFYTSTFPQQRLSKTAHSELAVRSFHARPSSLPQVAFASIRVMSVKGPICDIGGCLSDVRSSPVADLVGCTGTAGG